MRRETPKAARCRTDRRRAERRTGAALLGAAAASLAVTGLLAAVPDLRPAPAHRACDLSGGIWNGEVCARTDSPAHGTAL